MELPEKMTTEGGEAIAPLTRVDIPELVKTVTEALTKPPSDDPGTSGGKLLVIGVTACSYCVCGMAI